MAYVLVLGIALLTAIFSNAETSYAESAKLPIDIPIATVSLTDLNFRAAADTSDQTLNPQAGLTTRADEAPPAPRRDAFWSYDFFPARDFKLKANDDSRADSRAPSQAREIVGMPVALNLNSGNRKIRPFFAQYHSLVHDIATAEFGKKRQFAEETYTSIIGAASTYNPYLESKKAEDLKTASGEKYDPHAWTAAIQVNLRDQFRGVRFGSFYQPCYALIEAGNKKVIVKINDVGPLKPGRVVDLNERTMRYFDPNPQTGLVQDVKVTPLPGEVWIAGPISDIQLANVAAVQ